MPDTTAHTHNMVDERPGNAVDADRIATTLRNAAGAIEFLASENARLRSIEDQLVGEQLKTGPTKPYIVFADQGDFLKRAQGGHEMPGVKQTLNDAVQAVGDVIASGAAGLGLTVHGAKPQGFDACITMPTDASALERVATTVRLAEDRNRRAERRLERALASVSSAEEGLAFSKNNLINARRELDAFISGGQA